MEGSSLEYDAIGKLDLTNIYDQPTPLDYFSTLSQLDYCVADEARPAFQRLIEARRDLRDQSEVTVLDVGCSYGINAALLKYGRSLEELNSHYLDHDGTAREELVSLDGEFFDTPADDQVRMIGIDNAARAVRYAVDAGILDAGVALNLEAADPGPEAVSVLENADLVISTGCYGYVTERTFERILENCQVSRPWLANMVLRMFDYSDASRMLERHGYVTERVPGLVRQRRFASPEEQLRVLGNLDVAGVDPAGLEARGWYYAELFVSLPRDEAGAVELEALAHPLPIAAQADRADMIGTEPAEAGAVE